MVYGALMRKIWITFTRDGSVESLGWPRVVASGQPQTSTLRYVVAVLNTTITPITNLKQPVCNWWSNKGFGEVFWWTG